MHPIAAILLAALPFKSEPLPNAAAEARGVGFAPKIVYLRLAPGESAKQTFHLVNYEKLAAYFVLSTMDTWSDSQKVGERRFAPAGTLEHGAGKWLVDPDGQRVRVPGKQSVAVDEIITVPPGTAPGTYLGSMMFGFSSFENEEGKESPGYTIEAGVRVNRIAGVVLHIDVKKPDAPPPSPDVKLAETQVRAPTASEPLVVRMMLDNPSRWEVKPQGTLVVLTRDGRPLGKVAFDDAQLWPEQKAWMQATFAEKLAPGRYQALVAISMQDPDDQGAFYATPPVKQKLEFEVKPPAAASSAAPPPASKQGH